MALSCEALSAVPCEIEAGVGHITRVGLALVTVSDTVVCTEAQSVLSVGVKSTESVCVPAGSTSPAAGV